MKRFSILLLSFFAFIATVPSISMAQIPTPPDPSCASCGVNLRKNEPHKPWCEYVKAAQSHDDEQTSSQPTTPKSQPKPQAKPKPSTHLQDYKPSAEATAAERKRKEREEYQRLYRNGEISYEYMEMNLSDVIDFRGNYSTHNVAGKGMGMWFHDPDANYKTSMNKNWHYSPHYERICFMKGERAAMQLKTTKKWGVENYEKHENLVNFEYDEIKYFKESYEKYPAFFLNQKDELGRDRWYLYDGNDFPVEFPFKSVELKSESGDYRAYAQTLGGDWYLITGFRQAPGNLNIFGPFKEMSENTLCTYSKHLIVSKIDNDGRIRYGIISLDGQVLYNFAYDKIEHSPSSLANYVKVWKNGHLGVLELMTMKGQDGKEYKRYVESIEPKYDMFKTTRVWVSKLSRSYQYCVVGNNDRYALTLGDIYEPITLPTIYTITEVENFAERFFTESNNSKPLKEDKDMDYKQFCEVRAINTYKELKSKAITAEDVEEMLNENRLTRDYLYKQTEIHRKDLKLGKYDEAKQAFEVKSPWGTISLPVPKDEAEDVKKNWNKGISDYTIRPCLQLNPDTFRPVMWNVQALVNGKYYGYREQ
ncbi:MAG: hypothetical protein IKX51_01310 [Bacteroidales bacterium]|nr:hypothetical protein [Bacteroidales bacterium]